MAISVDPKRNHLRAVLPPAEGSRWLPLLDRVEMPVGDGLYEAGGEMTCQLSHQFDPLSTLDQHLRHWLPLSLDRLQGDELVMTQELIATCWAWHLVVQRPAARELASRYVR
jgi:hypothetical protein